MKYPELMLGRPVRDGDFTGEVSERYTTRTDRGPHREITVRHVDGREAVYVDDEIDALEPM